MIQTIRWLSIIFWQSCFWKSLIFSIIFGAIPRVYNFHDENSQSVPRESIGQEAAVLWLKQYKYQAIDDLTAVETHPSL